MLDDKLFICVDVSHIINEQLHILDKPTFQRVTEFINLHAPKVHEIMEVDSSDFDLKIAMYSISSAFYRRKPDRRPYIAICIDEIRNKAQGYPFDQYYGLAGVKTIEHRAMFTYIHELQHYKQIEIEKKLNIIVGLATWLDQEYSIMVDLDGKTYALKSTSNEQIGYYSLPWEVDANNTAISVFKQLNIT